MSTIVELNLEAKVQIKKLVSLNRYNIPKELSNGEREKNWQGKSLLIVIDKVNKLMFYKYNVNIKIYDID